MPSSKNYVRNYAEEAKTSKARGEIDAGPNSPHDKRGRDRREALKLGMIKPSQTLDHKVPLSKGGSSKPSNFGGKTLSQNDSYSRNPDGSMKNNTPKQDGPASDIKPEPILKKKLDGPPSSMKGK